MTTPEPTPAPDEPTVDTTALTPEPDTTAPADAPTEVDTEPDSPNSEAAKRRRQLRETQTELSTVRDQLDQVNVERQTPVLIDLRGKDAMTTP